MDSDLLVNLYNDFNVYPFLKLMALEFHSIPLYFTTASKFKKLFS